MRSAPLPLARRLQRSAQRGISLVFSLITLVALSLAAVALIRSVDTGATILGNLSFKQDTLLGADEATRAALDWLTSNAGNTALHANVVAQGYSASVIANLDPTGKGTAGNRVLVDWDMNDCDGFANCFKPNQTLLRLRNGDVQARWIIVRQCDAAGDPAVNTTIRCANPITRSAAGNTERGELRYDDPRLQQTTLSQYFRVIVRARGGRNTTSITETLVHY